LENLVDEKIEADLKHIHEYQARVVEVTQLRPEDFSGPAAADYGVSAQEAREIKTSRQPRESERSRRLYPVWYCTSRKELSPFAGPHWYSATRETGGIRHLGICLVAIPESHTFGEKKSSFWRWLLPIPKDEFAIYSLDKLKEERFWSSAQEGLDVMHADEKDGLVYVHGFNTSFVDSVRRAAQIGYDLKFPGITTVFSWPSQGSLSPVSYLADSAAITAHGSYLAAFVRDLLDNTKCGAVHLIGHSMGALAILRGCIGSGILSPKHVSRIGQVIFAAPDVDDQEFAKQAPQLTGLRSTLYASNSDSALKFSTGLHKFKRAGALPPPTIVAGVDTVDVSNIDLSTLGHGYVAQTREVLYDMYMLVRHNTSPAGRPRLVAAKHKAESYWKFT
jgi:esterase/lipase superfamily enzyme